MSAERQSFEEWAESQFYNLRRNGKDYGFRETSEAWAAFRAGRQCQPAPPSKGETNMTIATRCTEMTDRIVLAMDGWDSDSSETFLDEVFSKLLPDVHDLLTLLAAASAAPEPTPAAMAEVVSAVYGEGRLAGQEAQRKAEAKPLTREQVQEIVRKAGYHGGNHGGAIQARADFINGLRHGEMAHGIGASAGGGNG